MVNKFCFYIKIQLIGLPVTILRFNTLRPSCYDRNHLHFSNIQTLTCGPSQGPYTCCYQLIFKNDMSTEIVAACEPGKRVLFSE